MLNQKLMGKVGEDKTYIEDVFSTYLYTGTGGYQTINNGIDLAGKGGMVWAKNRSASGNNVVGDTVRGTYSTLFTNLTDAASGSSYLDYTSTGFTVINSNDWNVNGNNFASWTFRKAPKFFDVVTYTGDGVTTRTISHSLGVVPGMIIVKRTDAVSNWLSYNLGNGNYFAGQLNTTNALTNVGTPASLNVTSTNFRPSDLAVNGSGATYVAYLFAHDTTTDGLIQCGSFTSDAGGLATVNLGWEPQYVLTKRTDSTTDGEWVIRDIMRGLNSYNSPGALSANSTGAEPTGYNPVYLNGWGSSAPQSSNGFSYSGNLNATHIYMAIRRGPMKTPTDATKVFSPLTRTGDGAVTTNFPVDFNIARYRTATNAFYDFTRLCGESYLVNNTTAAEVATAGYPNWDSNTTFSTDSGYFGTTPSMIHWAFQRAPGFFDVVCYTGTGVARDINHNLGVVPELMIVKRRSSAGTGWGVYSASVGNTSFLRLNTTDASGVNATYWNNTSPTTSVFSLGTASPVNASGETYVAYLFASCPGVSKVGSFTGNGSTQNIDCGFTNGARFVMIKRTDSTGNWYVFDTARGIVASADPYLMLNSTATEDTYGDADLLDPYSAGFTVNNAGFSDINNSGGSYIYLAIA